MSEIRCWRLLRDLVASGDGVTGSGLYRIGTGGLVIFLLGVVVSFVVAVVLI
jgi:hypothetical protein